MQDQFNSEGIVFTVVTRLEVRKLRNLVSDIDPKAFIFTSIIKEAAGGMLKTCETLKGSALLFTPFFNMLNITAAGLLTDKNQH